MSFATDRIPSMEPLRRRHRSRNRASVWQVSLQHG